MDERFFLSDNLTPRSHFQHASMILSLSLSLSRLIRSLRAFSATLRSMKAHHSIASFPWARDKRTVKKEDMSVLRKLSKEFSATTYSRRTPTLRKKI